MNDDKKYMNDVKKLFELTSKSERLYLKDLGNRIIDYSENFPKSTYFDYIDHFGEPKEILISYYEHTNTETLIRRIKVRKSLITILLIVIVFLLIFSTVIYLSYSEGKESYIDREQVIIDDDEEEEIK